MLIDILLIKRRIKNQLFYISILHQKFKTKNIFLINFQTKTDPIHFSTSTLKQISTTSIE
jgi:hypothetical protein